MNDPASGLSVLHVIVRAGATNSQYNEHCLPVLADRRVTVCSLFPADVTPPPGLTLFEGDGTVRGSKRALRRALAFTEYDVVHVHAPSSGMLTLATYMRLRRPRRDLVFTVHNSWHSFGRRNRLFLRVIMALFPMVVVCGRAASDSIPRRLRRRRAHKLAIVANGVDVDRIDQVLASSEVDEQAATGRTVVSVNRLIPIKDPMTLVAAFAEAAHDDDGLVMIGDGSLRKEVLPAVRRRGLDDRVVLTGVVPRDDVYRLLKQSDVFVSTSRGEGLPVAMLEAMACGLPVVASDIPPHREIATTAQLVPLVPVGDPAGFARAIRRVLDLSDDEREQVGRHLRACVIEHHSVRAMNRAYGEIYVQVAHAVAAGRRPNLRSADKVDIVEESLSDKLRRRAGVVTLVTVLGAVGGFTFAHLQSPVFKSETTLMVGDTISAPKGEEQLKLTAALASTYADLARREPVLGPVAESGFAESWRALQGDIHVQTGDKNPHLVQVSVYAGSPDKASRLAQAVADQLMRVAGAGATSSQQTFVRGQLRDLEADITATSLELDAILQAVNSTPVEQQPALLATADQLRSRLIELRAGYAELEQLDTAAMGRLTPVDPPWVARSPLRPAPVAMAVGGAALGLALSVGWIHLFVQGRPISPVPSPRVAPEPVWSPVQNQRRGSRP
jgi:glycosyltransferase involved in cell wall biosynthesis